MRGRDGCWELGSASPRIYGLEAYSGDFCQLHGNLQDIFIQIQITLIIGERHLNLIPNLQETKIDDRSNSGSRDTDPIEVLLELEGQEEEVEKNSHFQVE